MKEKENGEIKDGDGKDGDKKDAEPPTPTVGIFELVHQIRST